MTPQPPARRNRRAPVAHDPDRVDTILDYLRERDSAADLTAKAVAMRLSRAAHRIELQIKRHLAPMGIELWELDILATLSRTGGTAPISLLQDSSQVTGGAITNRVTRLERAGFVTRSIHPTDRRQILVDLTTAGHARAAAVIEANDLAQREAMAGMDASLLTRLADDLRTFLLLSEGPAPGGRSDTGGDGSG